MGFLAYAGSTSGFFANNGGVVSAIPISTGQLTIRSAALSGERVVFSLGTGWTQDGIFTSKDGAVAAIARRLLNRPYFRNAFCGSIKRCWRAIWERRPVA